MGVSLEKRWVYSFCSYKPRVVLEDDRWVDLCLPGEEVGYFCSLYKSYLHVVFMYVWVDCSFSMVVKMSILNLNV